MARHIPDIRAIRSNVSFVIPYADFIANFTNVTNDANFNRLFFGKPYGPPHHRVERMGLGIC
jgi:hypothetical protein